MPIGVAPSRRLGVYPRGTRRPSTARTSPTRAASSSTAFTSCDVRPASCSANGQIGPLLEMNRRSPRNALGAYSTIPAMTASPAAPLAGSYDGADPAVGHRRHRRSGRRRDMISLRSVRARDETTPTGASSDPTGSRTGRASRRGDDRTTASGERPSRTPRRFVSADLRSTRGCPAGAPSTGNTPRGSVVTRTESQAESPMTPRLRVHCLPRHHRCAIRSSWAADEPVHGMNPSVVTSPSTTPQRRASTPALLLLVLPGLRLSWPHP
jgi:hypothetical protein